MWDKLRMKKENFGKRYLQTAVIGTALFLAGCVQRADTVEYTTDTEMPGNPTELHIIKNDADISEQDLEVLNEFARIFEQSVSDGEIPDLSGIFDQQSEKNMLAVAQWMSKPEFDRSDGQISCYSDFNIQHADTLEGNIRKVVFYLKHSIYRNDVYDMGSGYLITVYITDAKKASANENKSVIVEMAVDDVSFELIKQKLHEEYK